MSRYTISKSTVPVSFPLNGLDLGPFGPVECGELLISEKVSCALNLLVIVMCRCVWNITECLLSGPVLYDLYAICNHIGTVNMGHYTAACREEEGWCYYNDSWWVQFFLWPFLCNKIMVFKGRFSHTIYKNSNLLLFQII